MSRFRDRLVPVGAVLLIGMVAVVALTFVNSARDKSLSALEAAKNAEIRASADSRDQQLASFLNTTSALAAQPWSFEPGSEMDLAILNGYRSPDARTGFFLLDSGDEITQGVLLENGSLGMTYEHVDFDAVRHSDTFLAGRGAVLPVGDGLTTDSPVVAVVLPVIDPATGAYRGSLVAEVDVSPDASFNAELSALVRNKTDEVMMVDNRGTVVAASSPARLADSLAPSLARLGSGFHRLDGDVVVRAEIPSVGWSLIFRQSAAEFDEAVAQPLQTAAVLLIVLLAIVAGGVFLLLARRLRAAREEETRLRRLNESQEEFISIVSHELRTPVAGILGFLQTGLDHWDDMSESEHHAVMRRAATNARRLQALTRDVLDTESVEAGRLTFNFEPVDIVDEVRSAVDAASSVYEDHTITLQAAPGPITVNADPDRLQQVMTNLLDNAAKNSPPGAPIDVRLAEESGRIVVKVTDSGAGLDSALGDRMFDKFIRGRGSTVSGTGLGLYVCRLVVEAHGGKISGATAPDGSGTCFEFELPVVASPPKPLAEAAARS